MARRATRGDNAQFTYDFGIAIAQSTVNKVARLTGVTLSLASAFYALKTTAAEYVDTLRENTLRFGGVLSTMKAMQQAQDRLITGMSRFDVRDQMAGMNQLMAAGIDVKKNLDWIEKAAHATGRSFDQFSGMIASAVQGNLQGLVDAGLMTQRATRAFSKFQGNTVMMQNAIMNFLTKHKGLMSAIKNDFLTISDGTKRLQEVMTSFLQNILGKPNDPGSLYGSVARVLNMFADKFGKDGVLSENMRMLREYAQGIGVVMGWMVRTVGQMMLWLGKQAKRVTIEFLGTSEDFGKSMRSFVVWLEFWKLKLVDIIKSGINWLREFYEEHERLIKVIGEVLIAYLAWGVAWRMITRGTLLIQGMIFGLQALKRAIYAAGGAWAFFSKWMTVGLFSGAGNRSFFRIFGLTPYRVNAWFLNLGHGAATAFFRGFSFVKSFFVTTLPKAMRWFLNIFKAGWNSTLGGLGLGWNRFILGLKLTWNGFIKAIVNWFRFSYYLWNKPSVALRMILNGIRAVWQFVTKFRTAFTWVVKFIRWLPQIFRWLKNIRAVVTLIAGAFSSITPVGWVLIIVSIIDLLYSFWGGFRKAVNATFKFLWEWYKWQWNITYGIFVLLWASVKYTLKIVGAAFVFIWKCIKAVWRFLVDYIFEPVWGFFKWLWKIIKDGTKLLVEGAKFFWRAFMNTAVGKFINTYLVSPLISAFDYMLKAWNWIIKALGSVVSFLLGANSALAKSVNQLAEAQGLPKWAIESGDYNWNDDTNYIDKAFDYALDKFGNLLGGGNNSEPSGWNGNSYGSSNPLLQTVPADGGGGGSTTNNITLSNGAIQIVVPQGTDIDEQELARMIREEIRNLDRENRMRGGDI